MVYNKINKNQCSYKKLAKIKVSVRESYWHSLFPCDVTAGGKESGIPGGKLIFSFLRNKINLACSIWNPYKFMWFVLRSHSMVSSNRNLQVFFLTVGSILSMLLAIVEPMGSTQREN